VHTVRKKQFPQLSNLASVGATQNNGPVGETGPEFSDGDVRQVHQGGKTQMNKDPQGGKAP
jgi:hypothetical protein